MYEALLENQILITAIILWELLWKAIALWKAARLGDKVWYILILILNTVGILPICYIIFKKNAHKG